MDHGKTNILQGHVDQYTRLKTSAATVLPVLPPNLKLGVGNSCTNSNPVRQHREKKKCRLRRAFFKVKEDQHVVLHSDAYSLFL